ncbi:MAG TPA: hypothetical protein VGE72_24770 [Azospirillum sp.]
MTAADEARQRLTRDLNRRCHCITLDRAALLRAGGGGRRVRPLGPAVYQGQTTNFRTPGGGFAPVFIV